MQCCPLLGTALLNENKSTCTPRNENKADPRAAAGSPRRAQAQGRQREAASFRESCKVLHNVRDADTHNMHPRTRRCSKEVANNCAVSKLPAENKCPFARAFLNTQADLHSKSSSLPDNFKERFLIERQLMDQIPNQIPLHRPLNTPLVHGPNLCQAASPAPSLVSTPI